MQTGLLTPSGRAAGNGEWPHDVTVGGATRLGVATLFCSPTARLADLDGHWTFAWDAGLSWFEEALEVHRHDDIAWT